MGHVTSGACEVDRFPVIPLEPSPSVMRFCQTSCCEPNRVVNSVESEGVSEPCRSVAVLSSPLGQGWLRTPGAPTRMCGGDRGYGKRLLGLKARAFCHRLVERDGSRATERDTWDLRLKAARAMSGSRRVGRRFLGVLGVARPGSCLAWHKRWIARLLEVGMASLCFAV